MSARGAAAQVEAVLAIHTKREFNGDGYGWSICAEDRQAWPCATVKVIEDVTCPQCGGEGWTVEPVAQCGDYEHEHGEGCVVPEQVPCHCTRRAAKPGDAEEPF